jgi:hypothetical protein
MTLKRILIFVAILIFLACSIAIIRYVAEANFYTGGVFWHGATAGFMGCLFLGSAILTIFQVAAKGLSTKKRGLVFSMLILSGAIAAIFYSQKPGDSDVWWYGAIAGFLACLLLAFLVLIGFLFFKLKTKERIQA